MYSAISLQRLAKVDFVLNFSQLQQSDRSLQTNPVNETSSKYFNAEIEVYSYVRQTVKRGMFGLHTYRSVGSLHGRVKLKPFPAERESIKEPRKLQKNSKGNEGGGTLRHEEKERERLISQMHNFLPI